MLRAIHFDLSADNPERAASFYKSVFGWKVEKWQGPSDYWLMTTGDEKEPGITGGVAARIKPNDTTAVVFDVPSVDEYLEKVKLSGGQIREEKQAIRNHANRSISQMRNTTPANPSLNLTRYVGASRRLRSPLTRSVR
jgi:predicted enzyme related to lactoylglutathione lyase